MSKKNCFLLGDKSKEETKEEKLPELWNGEKIFCPWYVELPWLDVK